MILAEDHACADWAPTSASTVASAAAATGTQEAGCRCRGSNTRCVSCSRSTSCARTSRPPPVPVVRPVDLFGMKGKCMHCHQVNDNFYKREKPKATQLDKLRFLPLPEDVGL